MLNRISLSGHRGLDRGGRGNPWGWLVVPGTVFLLLFFVWPLGEMVVRSFTDPHVGFENYVRFFSSPADFSAIGTTFEISGLVTLTCAVVGYAYAYTMTIAARWARNLLMAAVLLPAAVSLLVRIFALEVILQDTGVINTTLEHLGLIRQPLPLIRTTLGTSIGMVSILLPYMVLPMYAVMRQIDKGYLSAAASLGAGPLRVLWRVYLPMSLPGVLTGSVIVFATGIGYYIVPSVLGNGDSLFMGQLVNFYINEAEWGYGSAIAVVLLVLVAVVLAVASRFIKLRDAFGSVAGGEV